MTTSNSLLGYLNPARLNLGHNPHSATAQKNINVKKDVVFLQRLFVWLTSGFLLAADLKWQIIGFSKSWREQEAFPVELRRKEKLGRYLLFYFPKSC
ncbi:hypothetical protein HO663_08915 [Streptococcus suis]|uniref:hypothetical protein n=1 Tax=Streptococcus suis TaxID=1307 RepID=UPI001298A7C6|nr:hypothetical protein [Streptococcus suis]MBY5027612.1 hypothetical protein [Streptococcus suis]NQH22933.1 hypothetical protein [Streptococcus suis]NQH28195.1 hypothetical protein [Streptococcus suis]NQN16658.1 hypothetical protein [Streptococcus suis]NQP13410.1 hypothetical protein [Streptococcus suis]